MDVTTYRSILTDIRDHLRRYDERRWSARLDDWLRELDHIHSPDELRSHLQRSQKATGGMGSIGDLTICPQAGHAIANDPAVIAAASKQLWALVSELYSEAKQLLSGL
jgi:hypothetical protein